QLALVEAGQLEDTAAGREDATVGVADDHAGAGRRVVVVHQLEQEAEAAAVAADRRRVGQALAPVVVDRAVLAVRADEVGHASIVAAPSTATVYDGSTRAGSAS